MAQASELPSSGNSYIDHQHGRLGELLRAAAQAARQSSDEESFRQALAAFRDFLTHHFAVEQIIIRGAGFDAATSHRQAHGVILGRVDTVLDSLDPLTSAPQRHRVLDELERILVDHEMLDDAAYWDAVRAHAKSPDLKWTALMVTGLDWVDHDHRLLVEQFNRLTLAADDGEASGLLQHFLDLARPHFQAEDGLIETLGDRAQAHRAYNARALAELDALIGAGDDPRLLAGHYLRFWLIDHILGLDLKNLGGTA